MTSENEAFRDSTVGREFTDVQRFDDGNTVGGTLRSVFFIPVSVLQRPRRDDLVMWRARYPVVVMQGETSRGVQESIARAINPPSVVLADVKKLSEENRES